MKVLLTAFSYYPQRHGIVSVSKYLAEGLAENGHEVCVATCRNGLETVDEEVINSVFVRRFDFGESLLKKPIGDVKGYINFVKSYGQDVLIMECLQCHTTDVLLPILKDLNCKVLIHAHGAPGLYMKPFMLCDSIKHTIGNTYNWALRKWYYSCYFPKHAKYIDASLSCCVCATDLPYFNKTIKRNYILENSADKMFFADISDDIDIKKQLGIKAKNYIVNIATFSERKNQSLLLDIFVNTKLKDCALIIIGTEKNSYYRQLVKKAAHLSTKEGCEIHIFDKSISRNQFPSIIKQAQLFVVTSKWEEYPITLVETMAVGTPFLSTLVGNAHTLPGGITARDESEFPILLKTLFDNPRKLERLSKMGREYAKTTNTPDIVISDLEAIINEI